jgi:hypothetical protein
VTVWPGFWAWTVDASSSEVRISLPATRWMMSPAELDRRAVLELGGQRARADPRLLGRAALLHALHEHALARGQVGPRDRAVDRQRGDPEVGALDRAVLLERREDLLGGVDRDREADADVAAAPVAGLDLRVDPDDPPRRIDERAARVARVDGRVGLDHVGDREVVRRGDLALQRRDHTGGQRAVQAERVADRDHRVADLHVLGRPERERPQRQAVGVDAQQREVRGRVAADDAGIDGLLVGELDGHLHRPVDDVGVREDVAGAVDDEPEPVALPRWARGTPKSNGEGSALCTTSALMNTTPGESRL